MNKQPQKQKSRPVMLVILPDTPNTRRLARVCWQISQRVPAQKAA